MNLAAENDIMHDERKIKCRFWIFLCSSLSKFIFCAQGDI